jgi:hypothetical protein
MKEREYFTRPISIDITAATIGINREDWYCHKPGIKQQDIKEKMLLKKYDVVPIIDKHGSLKQYFTIDVSDKSKLKINQINEDEKLYYLTHIRDVVWKMKNTNKSWFFLSNNRDKDDIVGLLSLSNYNSREFYVFLFNLISFIEKEFAALIMSDKIKGFQILEKRSHTKELKSQFEIIKERFKSDEESNVENDYKEYLYLHHLIWLVKAEEKYKNLKYKNGQDFESGTGDLSALRNIIAHPVKSLVRNFGELVKLERGMNKLYEFKEKLDEFK